MRRSLALILGVLWLVPVSALPDDPVWTLAYDPSHPKGQLQYASQVHPCDSATHSYPTWQNLIGDLTITKTRYWIGTDAGAPGEPYPQVDAFGVVYVSRPHGFKLTHHGVDRYAAPNGPHEKVETHQFPMAYGDQIGGGFKCTALWGLTSHIQVTIDIEFTVP